MDLPDEVREMLKRMPVERCLDCGKVHAVLGRCPNVPLKDDVVVKDSGQRQQFDTGAKRDIQAGKGRFDLLQWRALFKVARQLEEGAIKYDARNWEKGIPLSRYLDSATRHLAMFAMGRTDERHDVAVAWNILCLIDTAERIKEGLLPAELDDLPKAGK